MTEARDEYGERLRRILRAEAESFTPSPDGLERIRARVAARRRWTAVPWRNLPWLHPTLALGTALVVAGGVLFIASDLAGRQRPAPATPAPSSPTRDAGYIGAGRPPLGILPSPSRPPLPPEVTSPPPATPAFSTAPLPRPALSAQCATFSPAAPTSPRPAATSSASALPTPSVSCGSVPPGPQPSPQPSSPAASGPSEPPSASPPTPQPSAQSSQQVDFTASP